MELNAHDAARHFDCKRPGCTEAARSDRGTYAYLCDTHKAERRTELGLDGPSPRPLRAVTTADGRTYLEAAQVVMAAARRLDAALRRLEPLAVEAKQAKADYLDALDAMPRERPS